MEEIQEEEYIEQARAILLKKDATLNEDNDYKRRNKLAAHAFRRGYEAELVWSIIDKME
jgi:SOS response regulatory protein OraA/RecX